MKTLQDNSYGIIPVRKRAGAWEVFLIHQFSHIGNNSYWVFPKGHPEGQEAPFETALRELHEETGLTTTALLTDKTFTLKYSFMFEGKRIEKTVCFFLCTIDEGVVKLQAHEVKEADWFTLEAAAQRLDYADTKQMFTEVCDFLKTQ